MWEEVASRRHRPHKVFPATFPAAAAGEGTGSDGGPDRAVEFMVHGSLDLGLRTGELVCVAWAARAVLRREEGGEGGNRLRFALYQVYMHRYVSLRDSPNRCAFITAGFTRTKQQKGGGRGRVMVARSFVCLSFVGVVRLPYLTVAAAAAVVVCSRCGRCCALPIRSGAYVRN